jgi:RNA polymerase I-specific transcription initiation factor RRN6
MADRRVPDLSYGHVGDASYDINEGKWKFSVDTSRSKLPYTCRAGPFLKLSLAQIFEQIGPFKENFAATIQNVPKTTRKLQTTAKSHMKWVVKTRPEVFPASTIISTLAKSSATQQEYPPSYGPLIAIGGAVDADRRSGDRTHSVIAIPCGDAGHVLRLIRPQVEYHGWGKHSSVKLPLLDTASGDVAYWVGTGGTIRQIAFSSDKHGSGTLLATRQDFVITIFRPMYHKHPVKATTPSGYARQYPPSRLAVNPVAILKSEVCDSGTHADISFNPFYDRQFAVVDDSGRWSIWDTEGWTRKKPGKTGLELVRGKSGRIHDDFALSSHERGRDTLGGWHRILWVANVSTIVVCSRSHITAFDVKSTPSRLPGPERLSIKSNDWILDIKRSPLNKSQIFVLTTYRVFWIEVIATGEEKGGHDAAIRVVLSYRHFRDVSDETLSLTILQEEDGK